MSNVKIKWEKDRNAPIPDYHDRDGRWRIYRSGVTKVWHLQDRHSANHPDPVLYTNTLAAAKWEANERGASK